MSETVASPLGSTRCSVRRKAALPAHHLAWADKCESNTKDKPRFADAPACDDLAEFRAHDVARLHQLARPRSFRRDRAMLARAAGHRNRLSGFRPARNKADTFS